MLEGEREEGLQQGCKHMTSTKCDEKRVKAGTGAVAHDVFTDGQKPDCSFTVLPVPRE